MAGQGLDFDYLIVGSGFGGSVSALRLAEKGYAVAVMEQGRRWGPDNLPKTNWRLRDFLWAPRAGLRGFMSIRLFRHVLVLHGNAVGGGSITYAQTLLVPPDSVWSEGSWAGLDDWARVMPGHFAEAERMLGVGENRRPAAADAKLRELAALAAVEDTFRLTRVGVYFGDDGTPEGAAHPDPYFAGEGPARNACIGCGGCMVGCRHNAKNTLDKNYLWLAERRGAEVFAETRVIDIRPLGARGEDGYEVMTEPSFGTPARRRAGRKTWRAGAVVVAGSALGTMTLLHDLRDRGRLPALSKALGRRVRTNAESLIGLRFPGTREDLSKGVAIGSGIHINAHTHIEATRYPDGSNLMAGLQTVLTGGRAGPARLGHWVAAMARLAVTHPIRGLRALLPYRWARESMIFLVMQTLDGHIDMLWRRPWWGGRKRLASSGARIPTFIPEANDFVASAARATGGIGMSSLSEILFNVPMTAHLMGGCAMAAGPESGVIDANNRVFGYDNLYVVDGSMLAANLGVNPSLTIAALAERAMSLIPPKAAENGAE